MRAYLPLCSFLCFLHTNCLQPLPIYIQTKDILTTSQSIPRGTQARLRPLGGFRDSQFLQPSNPFRVPSPQYHERTAKTIQLAMSYYSPVSEQQTIPSHQTDCSKIHQPCPSRSQNTYSVSPARLLSLSSQFMILRESSEVNGSRKLD